MLGMMRLMLDVMHFCRKKLTMDEIHDIHGLRLIVENEKDCYAALDIVHHLWPEVPGRLKDYIKHSKSNGYVLDMSADSMIRVCSAFS